MPVAPVSAVNAAAPVAAAAEAALLAGRTVEATLLALIGDGAGGAQQAVLSLGGRTVRAVIDSLPPGTPAPAPNQRVLVVLTPEAQALAALAAPLSGRADPKQPASAAPEPDGGAPATLLLRASALKTAFTAALGNKDAPVSGQSRASSATPDTSDPAGRAPAQVPLSPRVAPPVDPAALLKGALPTVVAAQGGSAALYAALPALDAPDVPAPVREAARALLALRLDPGAPEPASALKAAFARSGLFFEHVLRDGGAPADLKAALLALKAALPAPPPASSRPAETGAHPAAPVPPPLRGAAPQGEAPSPPVLPLTRPDALAAVRDETVSSLARLQLAQIASLDPPPVPGALDPPGRQWTFELPLVLRDGTGVAQFRLVEEREARASGASQADAAKRWRLRFSVATTQDGAVDAEVAAQGGRVAVSIRAERDETAARLEARRNDLLATLESGGVDTIGVDIRAGRLPAPPVPPGRVLDRVS